MVQAKLPQIFVISCKPMFVIEDLKDQLLGQLCAAPPLDAPTSPLKPAAVLILLYPKNGLTHVVLTQRTHKVSHHRGQISLPGGKWESRDAHFIETALRECHEEVGVWPGHVSIWGCLPPMPTLSDFWVVPVVGWLEHLTSFQTNPDEIEVLIEVPLSALLEPQRWCHDQRWYEGALYDVYYFDYDTYLIWGITGQILYDFVNLLR